MRFPSFSAPPFSLAVLPALLTVAVAGGCAGRHEAPPPPHPGLNASAEAARDGGEDDSLPVVVLDDARAGAHDDAREEAASDGAASPSAAPLIAETKPSKPKVDAQADAAAGAPAGYAAPAEARAEINAMAAAPAYGSLARTRESSIGFLQPDFALPPIDAEDRERYEHLADNPVRLVADEPVSTFSLDVDTGSYSNVRRFLAEGRRPPEDAVRVEELVNYFPYEHARGSGEHPFGVRTDLAPCPWNEDHWLLRVGVRADDVAAATMPAGNLVFLVDVSGSMDQAAKLPLLRSSLKLLAGELRAQDRVSLVVYAGREAVVLEPTPGDQRARIEGAIDALTAGGSTAGEAGIRLAYRLARQNFVRGGINRVLLATDGDFNVGVTDFDQLLDLAERERDSGVQISTLGFGAGNLNEQLLERLADTGNGSYAYIDTLAEGRKVLVEQVRSTLVTVAKDVKVQVEFNPATVAEYRLVGYENRTLAREDFANDRVDAGDVGAGQTVTALYEVTPAGAVPSADPLRYGAARDEASRAEAAAPRALPAIEVAFVKIRYKKPDEQASRLLQLPVERRTLAASFAAAPDDLRFAAAVAGFGQILRGGRHTKAWSLDDVIAAAASARGRDEFGYRAEFLSLVRMAKVAS